MNTVSEREFDSNYFQSNGVLKLRIPRQVQTLKDFLKCKILSISEYNNLSNVIR